MKLNYVNYLLLLFIGLLMTSCHQKSLSKKGKALHKIGDHKEWANMEFDDKNWEQDVILENGEIFWSRIKIDILENPKEFQTFGLDLVNTFGEFEIYWDGVLIGENGNPGEEEKLGLTGELWRAYRIPLELSNKGEHQLALKRSLYYYPIHKGVRAYVNDYDYLLQFPLIYTALMHIFAGAFLLAALYFFFLFIVNKKEKPTLILSVSCFLFFSLIIMEFIRCYVPIHYSRQFIRLEIIGFLTFIIAILIPLYFSLQFPFPKRKGILIVYSFFLIYIFYRSHTQYDNTAYNMALTFWFFSLGIVCYGVYKKMKGASIVLITLVICALINATVYYDTSLFAGFGVILLGMFYILSVKTKEQRVAYENSLVKSTRLRLELLKKNIQPHFLMNTLMSLIDWVEESPKKGVLFIEELAKEFDLLNQIEDQTLIPVTQEIELCRTHLNIMKYRKEVDYEWEETGIDSSQMIPPAILHTLLENGITHCSPLSDNSIKFKLIFDTENDFNCYTLLTLAKVRNPTKILKDGTGNRYIKARLTESFDVNWSFTSEPTEEGWKNCIKTPN